METKIATATMYGRNGTYETGIEYATDAEHVHHRVRRPLPTRTVLGYGLVGGVGLVVTRCAHDGAMSEWRSSGWGDHTKLRVVERPLNPPYIGTLPNEEHGAVWGDPIDVPSAEPDRILIGDREVSEAEAQAAIAAYAQR